MANTTENLKINLTPATGESTQYTLASKNYVDMADNALQNALQADINKKEFYIQNKNSISSLFFDSPNSYYSDSINISSAYMRDDVTYNISIYLVKGNKINKIEGGYIQFSYRPVGSTGPSSTSLTSIPSATEYSNCVSVEKTIPFAFQNDTSGTSDSKRLIILDLEFYKVWPESHDVGWTIKPRIGNIYGGTISSLYKPSESTPVALFDGYKIYLNLQPIN